MTRTTLDRFLAVLAVPALVAATPARAVDTDLEKSIQGMLSEAYATTILLTDGDTLQLGLVNFNPNDYVELDDEDLGTPESISGRERIQSLSLPLSFDIDLDVPRQSLQAGIRLAFLREVERGTLTGSTLPEQDKFDTRIYAVSGSVQWQYRFQEDWRMSVAETLHLMRYENITEYRNVESRQVQGELDGLVTNVSSEAWVSQSTLGVSYFPPRFDARTELYSSINYMAGDSLRPSRDALDAEPEAWFWRNGVISRIPVLHGGRGVQHVLLKLSRVNVGGDLRNPMGSSAFYELGAGFYSGVGENIPFVDSVGLILNLNYGSNLRGGTIGVLYNVD